jgi:serine O-acetyltransferase
MRRKLLKLILKKVLPWLAERSRCREVVFCDARRWTEALREGAEPAGEDALAQHFLLHPEFRTLYYRRLGNWRRGVSVLKCFFRPLESCYLSCADIGPGLFIQHGFSTILLAHSVGANCWINQNVTVGYTAKGCPTVGNHVTIGAGAIVIGPITIGDHAVIGAGAVVVKSVPPGATVVGNPARIIKQSAVNDL